MNWRIDLILTGIMHWLGIGWMLAAIFVLLFVAFGQMIRSVLLAMFVLICTQTWYQPLYMLSRNLRWQLLAMLFARGAIFVVRAERPRGEGQFARWLVVSLAALAVLSTAWSENPKFSFEFSASFCLGLFITFGLLWRMIDDENVVAAFVQGTLVLALVAFGGGFLVVWVATVTNDWVFLDASGWQEGGRYSGVFHNPNAAGLIGAMVLPILVAAPTSYLGRGAKLRLLACGLVGATIFLSGSRSALIGSAMALVLLALYRYGAGAVITLALAGCGVAALAVFDPVENIDSTAVGHITRTKHLSTLSGRAELWQEGWAAAQDSMLIGHGWGFSRAMSGEVDLDRAMETGAVSGGTNLHNAHLQLLIDAGLIGVGIFWAFIGCVLAAGVRILRAPRNARNAFSLVVFASALGVIADSWVHGSIWSMGSPTTLIFWGLCAVAIKEGDRVRREFFAAKPPPPVYSLPPQPPRPVPALA